MENEAFEQWWNSYAGTPLDCCRDVEDYARTAFAAGQAAEREATIPVISDIASDHCACEFDRKCGACIVGDELAAAIRARG